MVWLILVILKLSKLRSTTRAIFFVHLCTDGLQSLESTKLGYYISTKYTTDKTAHDKQC